MKKQLSLRLISYEIRNIVGNIFVIFFGVFFPILMSILFSFVFKGQASGLIYQQIMTGIFITMSLIIPLAVLLIGYAANYSQELEKDIPLRFSLFGYSQRSMLLAKMIAYLIFTTGALLIYVTVDFMVLDLLIPTFTSAMILIASLYGLAVLLFILAHGIATYFKKFGPTYAATMSLYFGFMTLCGMMGINVNQLPSGMKTIARLLPMSYISTDFIDFWQGGSYRFAPFIQSFLFFGAVCTIILLLSLRREARIVK